MKLDFIGLLKCPYCGSDFGTGAVYEENNEELINGSVKCDCGEFAITDGILNVKSGPLNNYILSALAAHKPEEAVGLSIWKYSEEVCRIASLLGLGVPGRLLLALARNRARHIYMKYTNKNLPFFNLLGNDESDIYLKHRFSTESFWSVYPFVQVLKEKNERILDLSCGSGHASFVLSKHVKPGKLVCADYSFRNLYQAKKYFVKDAQFICLDANYPLPFKDNSFSTVFNLDAFHYVRARSQLAGEMERLIMPEGVLLLLHLHNSMVSNDTARDGIPLPPQNWIRLFKNLPFKAFPEKSIITDYIGNNSLDLTKEYTESELNADNAIHLLGTTDKALIKEYEGIDDELLKHRDNLIINPIYEIEKGNEGLILHRRIPSKPFGYEYPLTLEHFPENITLDKRLGNILEERKLDLTKAAISDEDLSVIEDLIKMFILIDVPENYC
ncbi:class I SAM-dependent methyltransferase [Chloroflexota bacterium]